VIFYDAAYEAYIVDEDVPHSIYESRARARWRSESRSFSKNAGFTGMRVAYTVVPKAAHGRSADGRAHGLNGVGPAREHEVQRPALRDPEGRAAVYTPDGQKQVRALIDFYMTNARVIREGPRRRRLHRSTAAANAPYIWFGTRRACRRGISSIASGGRADRRPARRGLRPAARVTSGSPPSLARANRGSGRADRARASPLMPALTLGRRRKVCHTRLGPETAATANGAQRKVSSMLNGECRGGTVMRGALMVKLVFCLTRLPQPVARGVPALLARAARAAGA